MRYHVMAGDQTGVLALKRDTIEGALKKAGELRDSGTYNDVRIVDTATGAVVDEADLARGSDVAGS